MEFIFLLMLALHLSPTLYHKEPLYVELATQVQNEVVKRITSKHEVQVVGDYGALFDKVNELGVRLEMKGPVSKDELRYIVIDCIQEYLFYINADGAIRPFLKNYPFTPNNLDIAIFVHGKTKDDYKLYYPNIREFA